MTETESNSQGPQKAAEGQHGASEHRSITAIVDEFQARLHADCNHRVHACPCVCGCAMVIPCDCWGGPSALCTDCDVRVMRGDDQHGGPESAAGRLQAECARLTAALTAAEADVARLRARTRALQHTYSQTLAPLQKRLAWFEGLWDRSLRWIEQHQPDDEREAIEAWIARAPADVQDRIVRHPCSPAERARLGAMLVIVEQADAARAVQDAAWRALVGELAEWCGMLLELTDATAPIVEQTYGRADPEGWVAQRETVACIRARLRQRLAALDGTA